MAEIGMVKLQGVRYRKHIDQFLPGFQFAIAPDRPCHVITLTLRALSYKPNTRKAIFWVLLAYHTRKLCITITLCQRNEIHIHMRLTENIHVLRVRLAMDTGKPLGDLQNILVR